MFEVSEFALKNIFDFATFRRFIIPSFQRDYAWGWEECEKLWSNIYDEYIESGYQNYYFLGTIITYKTDSSKNGKVPEVNIIDGQQRITTLLLLFRAIHHVLSGKIEHIDDTETKSVMSQLLRDVALKICQPEINDIGIARPNFNEPRLLRSTPHNSIAEIIADGHMTVTDNNDNSITTDYTDGNNLNIFLNEKKKINERRRGRRRQLPEDLEKYLDSNEYTNYALFIDKVKSLDLSIIGFTRFLFENCILLNIMPPSQDYAFTIFDTLNNSGLQLEPSDIVKNYIFELAN